MQNLGSRLTKTTLDFTFLTTNASGAPTALAGTPAVSVYKDNNTTQTTTGVTLTTNFDSVTGLNHVRIVTTDSFYVAGSTYNVVITAGTVDSNSVVGSTVAIFRLDSPLEGRTWHVSTSGSSSNPGTFDAPLNTFANALSAASPGDSIHLMAGTYTAAVYNNSKENIRVYGDGTESTIVNVALGPAATCHHGMTLENMQLNGNDASFGAGVLVQAVNNVTLRNLKCYGGFDGIQVWFGCEQCKIENCVGYATYDGLNFSYVKNLVVRDSYFYSTGTYTTANSVRGAIGIEADAKFINCTFEATKGVANAIEVGGIHWSGDRHHVVLENCNIIARATNASNTGKVTGIADTVGEEGQTNGSVSNCVFYTENAGSGGAYDIDLSQEAGSRLMIAGCRLNRSKVLEHANATNLQAIYEGRVSLDQYDPPTRAEATADIAATATATINAMAEEALNETVVGNWEPDGVLSRLYLEANGAKSAAQSVDTKLDDVQTASQAETDKTEILDAVDDINAASNINSPYDDNEVADELTFLVESLRGSAAGSVRDKLILNAAGGCRFALDFRRMTESNLTQVSSVTFEGAQTTDWAATTFNGYAGAVWGKTAIVTLTGYEAGQSGTATVVVARKVGPPVAAEIEVAFE